MSIEIPSTMAKLYRHWEKHTANTPDDKRLTEVIPNAALARDIQAFIDERTMIWAKKQQGTPPPYTHDPILRQFRFCNILRELDRQTIEYHTLLRPIRDNFPLWLLNMFYARLVARPATVRAVGLLSFDQPKNEALYERLDNYPRPRYGTPYVFPVSTIIKSQTPTRELFITQYLPKIMNSIADEIQTWDNQSVLAGVEKIMPLFGYNLRFLWTEVLIDVAYQFPEYIDLFAHFPVGPGAAPTFARIDPTVDSTQLAHELGCLQIPSGLVLHGRPIILSAENWEGIGCEFRKYTNLTAGRGRKRYYTSASADEAIDS